MSAWGRTGFLKKFLLVFCSACRRKKERNIGWHQQENGALRVRAVPQMKGKHGRDTLDHEKWLCVGWLQLSWGLLRVRMFFSRNERSISSSKAYTQTDWRGDITAFYLWHLDMKRKQRKAHSNAQGGVSPGHLHNACHPTDSVFRSLILFFLFKNIHNRSIYIYIYMYGRMCLCIFYMHIFVYVKHILNRHDTTCLIGCLMLYQTN